MIQLANIEDLTRELAEVSQEHEAATHQTAQRVMGVLDRVGLAELVRWHVKLELLQEQPRALLPAPAKKRRTKKHETAPARTKDGAPSTAMKKGIGNRPEVREWRNKLVAPLVELDEDDQRDAIRELAKKTHDVPGVGPCTYKAETIRRWVSLYEPPAKERIPASKKHDNPRPLPRIHLGDEASKHRRLDCPAIKRCTILARRKQWKAFGCSECGGSGGKHA